MTDTPENGAAAAAGNGAQPQPTAPQMKILAQYIRDMSFENLLMQKGATTEVAPEIQVQVALDAKKRSADKQFEVVSKYTVRANNKSDKTPLFLLELEYGAIFMIDNIPDEQLHPFLLIECPRQVFPFARRIISDVTRDGGFPPLNLDMVDFVALYRQELARRAEAQKAEAAPAN